MGSIALAGALTGLGRGMVAQAEYKQKINFVELEAARQERLAAIQAARDDAREARREASEVARDVRREEHDVSMARTNMEADIKGRMLTGDIQGKQQEKEIASREKIAREENTSRENAAKIAAGKETSKASKWTLKASPVTTKGVDASNRYSETTAPQYSVTSPTGVTYVQVGDQFVLPGEGAAKPVKRGVDRIRNVQLTDEQMQHEEAILSQRPDTAELFIRRYGYLPLWFAHAVEGTTDADEK